jgi:L-ascorbate metabolism protein UlaG (beta-lactamase superfamily)
MKLTKYEHACFTVEKDGKLLIVDPGNLTTDLGSPENVAAIVVTHEHSDHFDPAALGAIIAHNPEATIYGPPEVVLQLSDTLPNQAVSAGDEINNGPFQLSFYGGEHQKPFTDSPAIANVGVLINDLIYHASDSFSLPHKPIHTLLLPMSGSWMSSQMARDFLFEVRPKVVIPTHDAILSSAGKNQCDKYWPVHADKVGAVYIRPLESVEING